MRMYNIVVDVPDDAEELSPEAMEALVIDLTQLAADHFPGGTGIIVVREE